MTRLPWTKFQDFYLRLGFLKVLVAVLDPNRLSASNDLVVRRLQELLFVPARSHPELWRRVGQDFPWAPERFMETTSQSSGRAAPRDREATVAQALLLLGDCSSQLYAITRKTAYKVLDWARDLGLVASGNQLSEMGILLRRRLPRESVSEFLRGNPLAWNPFVLADHDQLLFLFHLCEVDELTIEVLDELADPGVSEPIESAQAAEMTCRAFFRVLDDAHGRIAPSDLPALRRGRDLASTIAEELQLEDLIAKAGTKAHWRPSKSSKSPHLRGARVSAGMRPVRRTTKNADHQAIPRFEQLVDLGFLRKPAPEHAEARQTWEARRRWRYERLPSCRAWAEERRKTPDGTGPWHWRGFATAAMASGLVKTAQRRERPTPEVMAGFLWNAYEVVRRQAGHTPFHSVALMAMIDAAVAGSAIEMRDFHELMLRIKNGGFLRDHVFFASGNEIDRMFLLVRPGFVDGVGRVSAGLRACASG